MLTQLLHLLVFCQYYPGGVGVYEALMTSVLAAAGIPPSLTIPVTIMYRIINTLIQIVPGYIFYQKALTPEQATTMDDLVLSVSDFVAVFNQTISYAYPSVTIEGELESLRISQK